MNLTDEAGEELRAWVMMDPVSLYPGVMGAYEEF